MNDPQPRSNIIDFATARFKKMLVKTQFVFGCGHTGNRTDAAGPELCLTCEVFAIKQMLHVD